MTDNKTLAKRKPNELRDLIESPEFREQLKKALPNAMSPERFVRITATAMMRNPKLVTCTRESFFQCLLDLSALGIEPDGRRAHLIPRKNKQTNVTECTFVIDYKGIKELLYRHGDIIDEHSDVVGDLDHFEYEYGTNKHLRHVPNTRDRGRIYAAYSYITLPKGGTVFDVMSIEEIELVRKRSASSNDGPWKTDFSEMAKKTIFKRLAKSVPLSPKTRAAIENDDDTYELSTEPVGPAPIKRAVIGGTRELPSEPEDNGEIEPESPELPETSPEPEPEIPARVHQSPPEPVSAESKEDKPPGPLKLVREALRKSGFREGELLALLKTVRLVNQNVARIDLVPAKALLEALADWDNCLERLKLEREKAKDQTPAQPDDFPA